MKCRVFELTEKQIWENFIQKNNYKSFLQSWIWGELHEKDGHKIYRLAYGSDKNNIFALALFIKISAKRGTYLLCPHGPVFSEEVEHEKALRAIIQEIEKIAKKEKCDFLRICPLLEEKEDNKNIFKKLGLRPSPIHTHPELSWMLKLEDDEDSLLANMRKSTRYMVRRATKEGVEIEKSDNPKDVEKFWPIYKETSQRQGFVPFDKNFLKKEMEIFAQEKNVKLFFGTYKKEIIVAAMIVFYSDSAFYHHSGSIKKYENIGISHLLQWEAIKEAKEKGLSYYNFWGISPEDKPDHPWAGLSLFKKGFGGFSEKYLRSQDKPLSLKYYLNYIVETLRARKRGYN